LFFSFVAATEIGKKLWERRASPEGRECGSHEEIAVLGRVRISGAWGHYQRLSGEKGGDPPLGGNKVCLSG